jgi:hypothetical protein
MTASSSSPSSLNSSIDNHANSISNDVDKEDDNYSDNNVNVHNDNNTDDDQDKEDNGRGGGSTDTVVSYPVIGGFMKRRLDDWRRSVSLPTSELNEYDSTDRDPADLGDDKDEVLLLHHHPRRQTPKPIMTTELTCLTGYDEKIRVVKLSSPLEVERLRISNLPRQRLTWIQTRELIFLDWYVQQFPKKPQPKVFSKLLQCDVSVPKATDKKMRNLFTTLKQMYEALLAGDPIRQRPRYFSRESQSAITTESDATSTRAHTIHQSPTTAGPTESGAPSDAVASPSSSSSSPPSATTASASTNSIDSDDAAVDDDNDVPRWKGESKWLRTQPYLGLFVHFWVHYEALFLSNLYLFVPQEIEDDYWYYNAIADEIDEVGDVSEAVRELYDWLEKHPAVSLSGFTHDRSSLTSSRSLDVSIESNNATDMARIHRMKDNIKTQDRLTKKLKQYEYDLGKDYLEEKKHCHDYRYNMDERFKAAGFSNSDRKKAQDCVHIYNIINAFPVLHRCRAGYVGMVRMAKQYDQKTWESAFTVYENRHGKPYGWLKIKN